MLSLRFHNVYINDYCSTVGKNEKYGNVNGDLKLINDFYNNEKTFEQAQIKMEREVINNLLQRNNLLDQDIDLIIGGDLLNQITGTSYATNGFNISFLGVYAACSTFIESLILASTFLDSKYAKKIICVTGSHNLSSERQFRYPVEYGSIRNVNSTFTATGAISCLLSNKKGVIKIKSATVGSVFDYGIKDTNMIGAIMAPSAAETLVEHLNNNNETVDSYDLILTGDLGNVGLNIFKDYLFEEFHIKVSNVLDAGSLLYKNIPDINDGASGPFALPLYFFYNIIHKKKYKKILLIGTGSLHSSTLSNQGLSVPSIANVLELEVL